MISAPGRVLVTNLALPLKDTLYFFDAPIDTTHFLIKARGTATIQFSFNDLHEYFTLKPGVGYYEQNVKFNGTFSFISSIDNETMEIITWYGQS